MLSEVVQWEYSAEFTKLERSALQFADYFCQRPELVTDELTDYLRNELGDGGLVELTACIAKYLAIGRLITVLDLDQSCEIDVMSA
jgi:hypothetical protein